MMYRLSWRMFPVTIYTWISWLMSQWDSFCQFHFRYHPNNNLKDIEQLPFQDREYQKLLYEHRMIVFKEKTKSAYLRIRETLQVLDAAVMDHNLLQMTPRVASSGLLYLMLNKFFYMSEYSLIYYTGSDEVFHDTSLTMAFGNPSYTNHIVQSCRLEEGSNKVKELVCSFLSLAAEVSDPGTLEYAINYFESFVPMRCDYTPPLITRCLSREALEQQVYEEFLSFQTYNPYSREFVCTR